MRKLLLLTGFFIVAPILILINIVFLLSLSEQKNKPSFFSINSKAEQNVVYAALPTVQNISELGINKVDARIELVRQFFVRYGSPLEPYAKDIVEKADFYGLDFRLLPAIAMQESHLCREEPTGSHNCWGFGVYGGKAQNFENYPHAIDIVTKALAIRYKSSGLETPEQIVSKYTPSDNGKWVNGVTYFMNKLQ